MKKHFLLSLSALIAGIILLSSSSANALSGSSFNAARIIDDSVFFNGNSISSSDIQLFLNSKVQTCDTNGTQDSTHWNDVANRYYTRAEWGSINGYPAPYTCLKSFSQDSPAKPAETGLCNAYPGGTRSAADIIYQVGLSCGISQRALIVLLEKEQSLITDSWPWSIQYRSASGYGCPDTAPCDSEYYGFFNQVYNAARQFKRYARDESQFRYRAFRDNYIQYNPDPNCGGSTVGIQNQATAGLYNYTPYQPNASALANLYGDGDGCGAYGNRNFWRMYNDWFGPTTNNDDYWVLVKHPTDGRYFIATNYAIHYVPNQQALDDWGLSNVQPTTVTVEFITSRTYGSPLNRLLRDKYGNIFLMDGGKKHYVRDAKYLSLWQQDINSAITIHGLVSYVPDGDWLGYCAKSTTTPSNVWLMNGNKTLSINDPTLQAAWGCDSKQTANLTNKLINSYVSQGVASRYAASAGDGKKVIADQGQLYTNSDQQIVDFYTPSGQNPFSLDARLERLLATRNVSMFAQNISDGKWFYVENGKKHYISSGKLAELWGYVGNLTPMSSSLIGSLTGAADITPGARTISPDKYYVLDGTKKHYLPDGTSIIEWLPVGSVIEVMPNNVLDRYSDGPALSSPVGRTDIGDYFIAQNGSRIALTSFNLVDAWTATLAYVPTGNKLYNILAANGGLSYVVRDGSNYYYIEAGIRYSVPATLSNSWSLGQTTSISTQTLDRYTLSSRVMTPFVRYGNRTFSLNGLVKTELSSSLGNIVPNDKITTLQRNYFSENPNKSTYLLRSTTPSDGRLWLVSSNGKILLPGLAQALNLGYISKSVELSLLAPEALDAIPTISSAASLLIQSPTGSLKLLSFGQGLGLPNADTVNAYAAVTNSVTQVSQEVFNLFSVNRSASRLIRDDSGKIYWLEGGRKRWILNGSLLSTTYNGIPQTYLNSTASTIIPDGSNIN